MKFYSEIESDFFLPISDGRYINHHLDKSKLPKWFYEKYQDLITFIPKIKDLFAKFLINEYYNDIYNKEYQKYLVEKYKTKYLSINSNLNEDLTLLEIRNSIQYWGNVLELLFMIDSTLFEKSNFISMMQLYNSALIDIGSIDGSLKTKYLPNSWLLTSRGYLYNMQATAHEAGCYNAYYKEKMNWFLTKSELYIPQNKISTDKINPYPELSDISIILKSGYIKADTLDLLLHYINYCHFNYRIYDPKIIMISLGMIELRTDLFNFFERLELYTDSPKDSLRKVIEITNNKYLDVLIRCCGVSKIATFPYKTIITSLLTAKDDFREYLERGYNVCFIPPIIINKKTRMVEELNMNSPIISTYIENQVITENDFARGKIYTNHLKY